MAIIFFGEYDPYTSERFQYVILDPAPQPVLFQYILDWLD